MARSIAVLKLSPRIKNVITFAQSVASAMTSSAASFPSPVVSLTTFQADIAALSTAETAVLARTKGAVEARNAKLAVVKGDLEKLKTYVQGVADAATPSDAEAIVQGAGMGVRKVTLHDKAALSVKQGSVSGSINLEAKAAAKRAAYQWQYSTDQKTWTSLPQTLQAKTGTSGLTAGTTYYFRVQPLTMTGTEDWSQLVALLVK
jgi:hypothetical protein